MQVTDAQPINMETFTQILELDEDEAIRDFSSEMVWAFFGQAGVTFDDMDAALYVLLACDPLANPH